VTLSLTRKSTVLAAAVAVAGTVVLVRAVALEPVQVSSASMEPTLHVGSTVLVDKLSVRWDEIDRGDLVVTKQVYEKGDPVSAPSGETVITYHWSGSRFAQTYSSRNDYGKTAEDGPTPAPAD
jgi:signal peptidase I